MTYTCDLCGHSYTRAIDKLQDTNNNNPEDNNPDADTAESEEDYSQTGAEVKSDARSPWWIIVIGIMVIVIGLGVFLVGKKEKEEEQE